MLCENVCCVYYLMFFCAISSDSVQVCFALSGLIILIRCSLWQWHVCTNDTDYFFTHLTYPSQAVWLLPNFILADICLNFRRFRS